VFHGVRGSVDRAFVRAGEDDVITIDVPSVGARALGSVRDIDVTVVIKSIGVETPRTVFIAGDGKCETGRDAPCTLERLFCDVEPQCLDPGPGGADVQLLPTPDGARVSFRFPSSRRVGPLTLVVTDTEQRAPFELEQQRCRDVLDPDRGQRLDLLACIDEIVSTGSGSPGTPVPTPAAATAQPLIALSELLVLSAANDFQRICSDDAGDLPHCAGTSNYVTMTIESTGNLLIPMRWTNILRPKGGPYEERQVRCSSPVAPFKSGGGRIHVPSEAFLESWTVNGTAFGAPPLFVPQRLPDRPNEVTVFGTTDKDDSVLRIWRRRPWSFACTDSSAQACETGSAATDCVAGASCAATTEAYYACAGGARDTFPCTRPAHCPGGQCKAGSTCITVASATSTGASCTTDADCQAGEECGRGLFEFRDRAANGAIAVPRSASGGFPGVCDAGKREGELCGSSFACNAFVFGPARCVGYRAEAILFTE
jgi:hypothetical protein